MKNNIVPEIEYRTGYFDNGQLSYKHPLINGVYCGVLKSWYYNGKLKTEYTRIGDRGQGIEKNWNDDATRNRLRQWRNGNIHGLIIFFDYH